VIARIALLVCLAWLSVPVVAGETVIVMPTPGDARAQLNPAVAYDGKGIYLVVWQQGRNYYQSQSADILAARVDTQGRVLDRQPIVVCKAAASQEQPQVAYAGGRFLIVWHDFRNGRDWDVYAARVTPGGQVQEPDGFRVAGGPQNQAGPVVAPAGDSFLLVWQQYDRHYRLQASLISPAGGPGRVASLTHEGKPLRGGALALARVGEGWLLSWNDETGWVKGDMITRRFARLVAAAGVLRVADVQRAPSIHLGRSGGHFAGEAASALYAGWGVVGRSKRAAIGAVFDNRGAAPLANPNPEPAGQGSGWAPRQAMTLYDLSVPVDGPVAIAFGQGGYLAVAREAYAGTAKDVSRLRGSRLTRTGVRIDAAPNWPLLYETRERIANPALAGGERGFLLAFEQEDGAGRRQIRAMIVRGK
jgi:hypothetical protein